MNHDRNRRLADSQVDGVTPDGAPNCAVPIPTSPVTVCGGGRPPHQQRGSIAAATLPFTYKQALGPSSLEKTRVVLGWVRFLAGGRRGGPRGHPSPSDRPPEMLEREEHRQPHRAPGYGKDA